MEGLSLTRKWLAIAKTEFLVQTAKLRRVRKAASISLLLIGIIWALVIVPTIMSSILSGLGVQVELLFMAGFPSLMRSAMLFLWVIFLIYPISYAMQEIRIGQWEIMLSNNVSTRDMMFGMFLGKVPSYGFLVMYAAPIILSPFALFFEVSLLGQLIMYLTIFFVALSTLFLSNLITTAIQAKLGESSRGNDIAKALSMIVAFIVLIPMYGLMYFANSMSAVLGMDIFLLFPFTWGADIISWSVIIFNGVGISPSIFLSILKLDAIIDLLLLLSFTGLIIIIAFTSADRIFSFGAGPRTEKIITVGEENFFLRGIRKISPGNFGILVVNMIKEFTRKMQNVSRLIYGIAISILLPVILKYGPGSFSEEAPEVVHTIILMLTVLMLGLMLAMINGITFGGIGFLESKDQLWIIRSAPNGVRKFGKARITESLLLNIPIATFPSIIASLIFEFTFFEMLAIMGYTYWSTCGAVLLSTGITANNPAYENQKSSAFHVNTFASIFSIMIILMVSLFIGIEFIMASANIPIFMLIMSTPLIIIGTIVYVIGIERMAKAEVN
ncbi:MAG: hypothetical protein JW779_10730 [Candidatus Thorarchaeota archaeon]|nr:hypothetical protein [Candidatus Thorarchaeota archaeon]